MPSVHSSNLSHVNYDPATKVLSVAFKDGGTYLHHNVPAGIHAGLLIAPSKGKFYAKNVRGLYPTTKVA